MVALSAVVYAGIGKLKAVQEEAELPIIRS
jgi:hypothetical protein